MRRKVFPRRAKVTEQIHISSPPELKSLAGRAADEEGYPLSEWVVRLIAEKLKRPDLAVVPRKKMGRPRKEMVGG
jgi:hypothetical protein